MTDQTCASLSVQTIGPGGPIAIAAEDRAILSGLASRIVELAARPLEDEKQKLWYRHNALGETRPVVFCDPENGWNEIITNDHMKCKGKLAREWEMRLRKEVFWGEAMSDDRVTQLFFDIPYVYSESDWGMHEMRIGGQDGGAYTWDAPLKSYDDLGKLHPPHISVDMEATRQVLELAESVFSGLLTVRLKGGWWWSLGMTGILVNLRGLQNFMLDPYDHPAELHRLMSTLRDGTLAKLDFLEKNGLLSLNDDGTYVGSGGFGWTRELPRQDFDGKTVRTQDMWGFCESQETSTFSPAMFEEFVFRYQLPILERFGLNCYGCCEALDKRWHVVEKTPRLRRVSVSAWANLTDMAGKLGDRYICSLKPNPALLATPALDENSARRELRHALGVTRGCRVEIIMKDNHTIGKNPQNVIRWCQIAREEAEEV